MSYKQAEQDSKLVAEAEALLELSDVMDKHDLSFTYTTDDDGVHIMQGDRDIFVSHGMTAAHISQSVFANVKIVLARIRKHLAESLT